MLGGESGVKIGEESEIVAESRVRELVLLGAKLGITAFGGPAAHIAMLRQDVVAARGWMTDQRFLDLIGITNLIPGPNSTEMVMHVGHERAGGKGLVAAGLAFIVPAVLITLVFAWLYVEYGSTSEGAWVLLGIKPVVLAVVVQAIWNLGKTAVKRSHHLLAVALVAALWLLGVNELLLLGLGALVGVGVAQVHRRGQAPITSLAAPWLMIPAIATHPDVPYSLARLFLTFLKIGSVLYGSGYVLLAFIETDFVNHLGWITRQQLLDAVAIGQFTPGPVFTTATFVGYVVGGWPGAIAATIGIFLPAFVVVALAHRVMDAIADRPWTRPLLDSINLVAIGLMAAVTVSLARDAVVDWLTAGMFAAAMVLLIRFQINSALLVVAGATVSVLVHVL